MDWKSLGPIIGAVAPLAGSIIGGLIPFPGASMIGQKFGEIIARQFGVDPKAADAPKQVSDRIAEAGEETARAKINAALEQARAEIQGFVEVERIHTDALLKSALGTQELLKAEIGSQEHWFYRAWRPTAGWLYDVMVAVFGGLLAWATIRSVWASGDPLKTLNDAWPLFAAFLGALAVVNGILIPSRSVEKKAAIENGTPMPNAKPPQVLPTTPVSVPMPPVKPTLGPRPTIAKPPGSRD